MKYKAVITIDDDRWAKHPYSIRIFDEDGNTVEYHNPLDSWRACYRYAEKYGIPESEVEEDFC